MMSLQNTLKHQLSIQIGLKANHAHTFSVTTKSNQINDMILQ